MSFRFVVLLPCLALTACADLPSDATRGAILPYSAVLAETTGRPWECLGYDAASDTCESVARTTRRGSTFTTEGSLGRSAGRGGFYALRATGEMDEKGRVCFDPSDLDMRVGQGATTEEDRFITELTLGAMRELGRTCTAIYRQDDHYVAQSQTAAGQPVPGGRKTLHFFEHPKKLRPLGR